MSSEKQQLESFANSTIKAIAVADRSIKVEYKILQVDDRYPGVEIVATKSGAVKSPITQTVLSGVILKSTGDLVQKTAERIVSRLG